MATDHAPAVQVVEQHDEQGMLTARTEMAAGVPHGRMTSFGPNGKPALESSYVRGKLHGSVRMFDENGALLEAPQALWDALLQREWRRLFVELRPLWAEARLLLFGHALLEQLANPRKGLTAHVWCAQAPLQGLDEADAWLAGQCTAEAWAAKPFTPLPVLGVPGWHPENTNFSFYDDSHVFRPRKDAITTSRRDGFRPART